MRFLLPIIILLSSYSIADTINLASADYPPFYGKDIKDQGPVTKIVREAFGAVGHKVNIKFYPWVRGEKLAAECKVDGMFPPWDKPERRAWGIFSDPIPPANEIGFYRHNDNSEVLSDLKSNKDNISVGIVNGYVYPDSFLNSGMQTKVVNTDLNNLKKLLRKRIDLALLDKAQAKYLINTQIEEKHRNRLTWVEPSIQKNEQYLVMCKKAVNADKKIADFNAGLKIITDNGRVDEILSEHGLL